MFTTAHRVTRAVEFARCLACSAQPAGALASVLSKRANACRYDHCGVIVMRAGTPHVIEQTFSGIKVRRGVCANTCCHIAMTNALALPANACRRCEPCFQVRPYEQRVLWSKSHEIIVRPAGIKVRWAVSCASAGVAFERGNPTNA